MPTRTVKVAVSLPLEAYRQIEKARRRLRISRSAVVSEAIRRWIVTRREEEKVRAYVEGYRRVPETGQELKAFEPLVSEALASEEWKG